MLGVMEKEMTGKTYAVGSEFSFADISACAALGVARLAGYSLDSYPALAKYFGAATQRPSWQRVIQDAHAAAKAAGLA
jgi:glutathione S-transferase